MLNCIVCLHAQISPGDLTKAHQQYEGLSNCTMCHVLGEKVYSSKCLDCHTEIKSLKDQNKGYHSGRDVKNKECWSCHSEHHGRNFRIVNFNPGSFDHTETGFELTGDHKKITCRDCHRQKFIKNNLSKKKHDSYLGLDSECLSCHEDIHQGTLDRKCRECHSTESFSPASEFNHNKTKYILTGAHLNVDCIKCHPPGKNIQSRFRKFSVADFSGCGSCHKDVHQGRFGSDCRRCHSTSSFRQIAEEFFDHNKTNFPLLGKHTDVACINCHKNGLSNRPPFQKCSDCHSDHHKGEFSAVPGKDCSNCHIVNGFSPSVYSIEEHSETKFPLTGSHLAVPCGSCHFNNSEYHFKLSTECISCHKNIHEDEISLKYMPANDCTACHNTAAWSVVKFGHSKTDFILEDKHAETSCRNCHYRNERYQFASADGACTSCHNDVHSGQFGKNSSSGCERCHTFRNWQPDLFDHNKTLFPLEGAHVKLECSSCHKRETLNGTNFIKFKIEKFKCADCHS